jgi:hypothetical protein
MPSLTGSIKNSIFAKYRSAETASEERMRRQREARLQQHVRARTISVHPQLAIPATLD